MFPKKFSLFNLVFYALNVNINACLSQSVPSAVPYSPVFPPVILLEWV